MEGAARRKAALLVGKSHLGKTKHEVWIYRACGRKRALMFPKLSIK